MCSKRAVLEALHGNSSHGKEGERVPMALSWRQPFGTLKRRKSGYLILQACEHQLT